MAARTTIFAAIVMMTACGGHAVWERSPQRDSSDDDGDVPPRSGKPSSSHGGAAGSAGAAAQDAGTEPPPKPDEPKTRSRWLALNTFVSSASTQSPLYLVDLTAPEVSLVILESEHGTSEMYSPDGRWLIYSSNRAKNDARFYAVDMRGSKPGEPQLLFTTETYRPCSWSPDSKKLACHKQAADTAQPAQVIGFEMSGQKPSLPIELGKFNRDAYAFDTVTWLSAEQLAFPSTDNKLLIVKWNGAASTEPRLWDIPGAIALVSTDRKRAIFSGIRDHALPSDGSKMPTFSLVDFALGTRTPLKVFPYWSFSKTLEAAVAFDRPSSVSNTGVRLYYRIRGTDVIGHVGKIESTVNSWNWSRMLQDDGELWSGQRLIELRQERAVLLTVDDTGVTEKPVAGAYADVKLKKLSPDGQWLYLGTFTRGADNKPNTASAKHWLSRIVNGTPEPAIQIGSGYVGMRAHFSPDSQRLIVHGDDTVPQPSAFRLYDLRTPNAPKERTLDINLRWAETKWSPDSSYISILGGASSRDLYIVDTLADQSAPKLIITCTGNPAPTPGCPGGAVFQP